MACRGVHFALTAEQAAGLAAARDDAEVREWVAEIEEAWDRAWLVETDKAWDALHRCLTDGTLSDDGGSVLSQAVLGGTPCHEADDYVVVFVTAEEVAEVAAALAPLDEAWLRDRYFTLDFVDYQGVRDEDDFAYTAGNFDVLRAFFADAAGAGRAVVFTVDQ